MPPGCWLVASRAVSVRLVWPCVWSQVWPSVERSVVKTVLMEVGAMMRENEQLRRDLPRYHAFGHLAFDVIVESSGAALVEVGIYWWHFSCYGR